LKQINLWKQGLTHVPDSVWEQTDAEVLILADNRLTEISPAIGGMRALRTLDLGHNEIAAIPAEIGELVQLDRFLYLHDNRLNALPASLANLRRLRYLNISNNRFHELPAPVCAMQQLIELRVMDNELASLPAAIGHLEQLRELHLRNNRLRALPREAGELRALRQLDLRGNPIEVLPTSLLDLPHLEKVDLRWVTTLRSRDVVEQLEAKGCLVYE
jgi:Leucine-rich repeat (LRR) protein